MPAGNFIVFSAANEGIHRGTIDLDSDTFRMVLVTNGWTPNQNTDVAWSNISANEVSGAGYTANGQLLTCTVTQVANVMTFDCNDQTWSTSTITAKYAVIVRDANGDGALAAGDIPIAFVDLETGGGSVSSVAADFTVSINAAGVFTSTAAIS